MLTFVCENGSLFRPGDRHNQRLNRPRQIGGQAVIEYTSGADKVVIWRGAASGALAVFELVVAEMQSSSWIDARELAADHERQNNVSRIRSV